MKKVFGMVLCVLLVFVACKNKVDNKQKPKEEHKSSSANIIVSMSVKKDALMRSFKITEAKESTAILSLPSDHPFELNALKPIIEVSKGAKVSPASGVAQDFSGEKEVKYTVTAENGNTKVYTAKVKVLPPRRDLGEPSIRICGALVSEGEAVVDEDITTVVKKNVSIMFSGDGVPTEFSMKPEKLLLSKKGDRAKVKFFTEANDLWNAWKSEEITVIRAGLIPTPSSENKILSFKVGEMEGVINYNVSPKTIMCIVPYGTDLVNVVPTIKCSPGATVSPKSGEKKDFSNSKNQPVKYTVTAEDKTSDTYDVTVILGKSNIAKIKSLKVGSNDATIKEEDHTILLELEKTESLDNITPTIEPSPGATYTPQGAQNFKTATDNTIEYTVTAENGTDKQVYKVTIRHKKSKIARMKKFDVTIGSETKEGKIDHDGGKITVVLPASSDLTKVRPTVEAEDDGTVSPASGVEQNFSNGSIKYTVTSEDKSTNKEYDVTVRHVYTEAKIKSFRVGSHEGVITEGTPNKIVVEVEKTDKLDNITPVIEVSQGATYTPQGTQDFEKSTNNTIVYKVIAEDGSEQEYHVTVRHKKSNVAKIKKFILNSAANGTIPLHIPGDINHDAGTIKVTVPNGTSLTHITPYIEVEDDGTVNPGSNQVQNFTSDVVYTVTSEDTSVQKAYTVSVKQGASPLARIESFTLNVGQETYKAAILWNKADPSAPRRIEMIVPYGTQLKDIMPNIALVAGASISPAPNVPQDFSNGNVVTYTVTAEDNKTQIVYNAQILQTPPASNVEINNVPARLVNDMMTVTIPASKTKIVKSDLRVYYEEGGTKHDIESEKLTLGMKSQKKVIAVDSVDLDPTHDTTFYIILNMGKGYMPNAEMEIVATRQKIPPYPSVSIFDISATQIKPDNWDMKITIPNDKGDEITLDNIKLTYLEGGVETPVGKDKLKLAIWNGTNKEYEEQNKIILSSSAPSYFYIFMSIDGYKPNVIIQIEVLRS